MPLWLSSQGSGPDTIDMNSTGSGAERAMLPMVVAVAMRYSGQEFQFNLHDLNGWQTCPDQTEYKPPIRVRKVLLMDGTNTTRYISIDLAGNGENKRSAPMTLTLGIYPLLATNILHDLHITKIYLDSRDSNRATSLILFG